MPKRKWVWQDGELKQIEGPPEHVCGLEGFDGMQGDTCPACERIGQPIEAPEVVVPQRHRSAG